MSDSERHTSEYWSQLFSDKFIIHDYDGWNRKSIYQSFYIEKITLAEFKERLKRSTIQVIDKKFFE